MTPCRYFVKKDCAFAKAATLLELPLAPFLNSAQHVILPL